MITQVFSKRDVDNIQKEITTIVNPTKKVRDLEKKSEFSDTFQNRVNLADAYFEIRDYASAIINYNKAIDEHTDDDAHVHKMLVESYHELEDFEKLIQHAEKIKNNNEFQKSTTQFLYGLALDKVGRSGEAEAEMCHINQRYSNYNERVILVKFLIHRGKKDEAKEVLNDIITESEHMNKSNKKLYKLAIVEANKLIKEL